MKLYKKPSRISSKGGEVRRILAELVKYTCPTCKQGMELPASTLHTFVLRGLSPCCNVFKDGGPMPVQGRYPAAFIEQDWTGLANLLGAFRGGYKIQAYRPTPWGRQPADGKVSLSGPRYPRPATWWADVKCERGRVKQIMASGLYPPTVEAQAQAKPSKKGVRKRA